MKSSGLFAFICLLLTPIVNSSNVWPLPDGVRPQAPVQTWDDDGEIDFSGKGRVRGTSDGVSIGFTDIDGNHNQACDSGRCSGKSSLFLSEEPDFDAPNGVKKIDLKEKSGTLTGGVYESKKDEVLLKSGDVLTVTAPSTIYAENFKIDGGRIIVSSGNPDDLIIVVDDDAEFIDGGDFDAHIFADELTVKFTQIDGTLTADELKIDEGGVINGRTPSVGVPASQCDELKSNRNFSVRFSLNNVQLNESIRAVKGVGNNNPTPVILWANFGSASSAVIRDNQTQLGGSYHLWLTYTASNSSNKTGSLSYYLLTNGIWTLIDTKTADLRGLQSVNIDVESATGSIQNLYCQTNNTPPPTNLCEFFPEPAQSWSSGSRLDIQNAGNQISGWSQNYLNQNLSNNTLATSFDNVSYHAGLAGSCGDGIACGTGATKVSAPPSISGFFSSTQDLSIDPFNYETICDGVSYCDITEVGNDINIYIKDSLRNLTVSRQSSTKNLRVFFEPLAGGAGPEVQSYTVEGSFNAGVETNFAGNASYTFSKITFNSTNNVVNVSEGVVLYVESEFIQNNAVTFNDRGGKKDLIVYGPNASFTFNTTNTELSAQILANSVTFNNAVTLRGAVTTNTLSMPSTPTLIVGEGACLTPPLKNYQLTLAPTSGISLTCETQTATLSVTENGQLATDFTGTVSAKIDNDSYTFVPTNGELKKNVILQTTGTKTVSLEAYITGKQTDTTVTGSYQFVPYRFDVDDQFVIANKPIDVSANVLACNSGQVVDIGYTGQPAVTSSLQAPTDGSGTLTFAPSFSAGTASSPLTFDESGQLQVTLTDSNFNCSGVSGCPIDGEDTLTGSFTVNSRPWLLAICDPGDRALDGNITNATSFAYSKAGASFTLWLKALKWQTGNHESNPVTGVTRITSNESLCDQPITSNFSSSLAPSATLQLEHQVAEPTGGEHGNLTGSTSRTNTQSTSDNFVFNNLAWSEVGVLKVISKLSASYLGMQVNVSERDIGRFYPDHFAIVSNSFTYSTGHDQFAYLGQSIDHAFEVEARSVGNLPTVNYSRFSEDLIRDIQMVLTQPSQGNENISTRLTSTASTLLWDGSTNWTGARLSHSGELTVTRNVLPSLPLTTQADGPFEQGFGLWVKPVSQGGDKADDVDFQAPDLTITSSGTVQGTGKTLPTQGRFRYGRLNLTDVGGTSVSTIAVPLKVEYWNGSQFEISDLDSGSQYLSLADYTCKQIVWQNTALNPSGSALDGSINAAAPNRVAQGVSTQLKATPDTTSSNPSYREQVRYWLRMANSSPQIGSNGVICGANTLSQPWLQFNWLGRGDEDPTAIVTYGIHRGNDRVLFRGEQGFTGQ